MVAVRIKKETLKGEPCEFLFDRFKRKSFLHRIIIGDGKWIYFDNKIPSAKNHGQPSKSQPVLNIHRKHALLCIWWDQKGAVYYELLKPGEMVTGDRYREQLIKLNQTLKRQQPEWGGGGQNTQSNLAP